MLRPGLYEQVINKALSDELNVNRQFIDKLNIDKAEAPQILSGYLAEIIEKKRGFPVFQATISKGSWG